MGKRSGRYVPCENCGTLTYKTATHLKRSKHYFCSQECALKYRHTITHEVRTCEQCKKEFDVRKIDSKRFCSIECQHEWQKTRVGELNPKYTHIVFACDWCKQNYYDKKYKTNNKYHFCSSKCRKKWHRNIFSKNDEWVEISRQRAAKMLSDGQFSHTLTKPQKIVNDILDKMNIAYENEYNCKYYAVDNYLPEYNLIIEVMGDFWHLNPSKYSSIKYLSRLKSIRNDKKKHNYILKHLNINVLYLWESDILKAPEMCEALILSYIQNLGKLEDYQSFNFYEADKELMIKNDLMIPYFLMNDEELEKYIQLIA